MTKIQIIFKVEKESTARGRWTQRESGKNNKQINLLLDRNYSSMCSDYSKKFCNNI